MDGIALVAVKGQRHQTVDFARPRIAIPKEADCGISVLVTSPQPSQLSGFGIPHVP
jgi:hypothetical protein